MPVCAQELTSLGGKWGDAQSDDPSLALVSINSHRLHGYCKGTQVFLRMSRVWLSQHPCAARYLGSATSHEAAQSLAPATVTIQLGPPGPTASWGS